MARIEGISDKQANVFTRSVYGAVRRKLGRVPEPLRISAHQAPLLSAISLASETPAFLPTADPMSIQKRAPDQHGGLDSRQADFENSAEFSEVEKLALRYAVAMTATPAEIPEELFSAMRAQFDARQLVELTAAIAWENYRARFNHAFGCEAEGYSEGAYCPLPSRAGRRAGAG